MFALQKRISIGANWEPFSAKVVASDVINDVAILKTDESPFGDAPQFAPMKIGNAELTAHFATATLNPDLPKPGQQALLAGYPLGQPYLIVQEGNIAALAFDLPGWPPTNKILVSTFSNHGNSGAPVFDMQGKVIGILEGEDRAQGQDQERTGISVVIPAFFVSELAKTIAP
jgi:S1-C subfamily serine protease